MTLYELLFGKNHIRDGDVISFSEHGRVGGLSTGQGFKYGAIIDPVSGESPTVTGGKLDVNAAVNLGNVTLSGADGKILDASNASLAANVFDLANKKALATALVDASGNQITSLGGGFATVTAIQGDAGSNPWLATLSTLSAVVSGTVNAAQSGLWGVNISAMPAVTIDTTGLATSAKQDTGNTYLANLDVPLSTRLASGSTLPVTGNLGAAGGSLTAYQGGDAWKITLATLPVVASGTITANAGTNLNTSALALEGGNLATLAGKDFATQTTLNSILTNLNVKLDTRLASGGTLPITNSNLDVTLGSRLASGSTLPIVNANLDIALSTRLASGSTLPITNTYLSNLDVLLSTRLASGSTLPVTGNLGTAGGSLTAYQGGSWTVQPGNTPNTTAWLVTMGTLPIVGNLSVAGQATVTAIQGLAGTSPWLITLPTLPVVSGQGGTWTVQPGNTPNTTAWLVTMGTLPITGSLSVAGQATVTAIQGLAGTSPWLVTTATLPMVGTVNATGNLATLSSMVRYEDAAFTDLDPGIQTLGVRNDSLASITTANLDYSYFSVDQLGRQVMTRKSFNAMTTVVSGATVSTTLLSANQQRTGAYIFNNSTATLYIKFGTGATYPASFRQMITPNGAYEVINGYTGIISGVWTGSKNGVAVITEEY